MLQRHGGPDAQTWEGGSDWALGNNRLAIVDLDHGEQPYSLGNAIKVVFNGEIYNHRELRERLIGMGYTFADECDGSILPALYHRYGREFAEHLDGMFAIAVVDLREGPNLVLATDDAGMKPLYYHWDTVGGTLTFSSELPALLSIPGISNERWLGGLDSYLSTKTPFGEQTMFADVQVLPRAVTATFRPEEGLRIRGRREDQERTQPGSLEEAGQDVRELLARETRRLTIGDVPISTITSGGLDSSLVTALLADSVPDLHSFNIAYRGNWPFDERQYARQVADRAGTVYHQVESDPAEFPDLLESVIHHLGQPNADPITVSTFLLFRAVREGGFKVAITGDAADEIFGGYSRMRQALLDGSDWASNYVDALSAVPARLREQLYTADYRDYLRSGPTVAKRLEEQLRSAQGDRLDAITELEVGQRLPAYHLRRVDHLSMASAVEVRLPFCQPAMVRLARSLPRNYRIHGNEVKRALYAGARGLLPESVLDRPKQPFTLPVTSMLTEGSRLLEFARETLATDELTAGGQLDPHAVNGLIERQVANPSDESALAIWSLMVHQIWVRQAASAGAGATGLREVA